jgi:hypothetical protein
VIYPHPDALIRIQTNELDSFLTPASSRTTRGLLCEATLQLLRRPGDRQPRRRSRKVVARDYPSLADYEYVMRQALRPRCSFRQDDGKLIATVSRGRID